MKRLEFTDDLLTGFNEIDSQHRELFARGNAVLFPEAEKASFKDVCHALKFLYNYVDEHFSAEERLMKYYEYDRLENHRKQHQRLRKDVVELYRRTKEVGSVKGLENDLYYMFSDWYVYHIREWDIALVAFLKGHVERGDIMIPDFDENDVKILKPEDGFTPNELETLRKLRKE